MKNQTRSVHLHTTLLFCLLTLSFTQSFAQDFQRVYGTNLDNSFSKVIKDGTSYYVLGLHETSDGAPMTGTISRLDGSGVHQWTLSSNIACTWNDAVLTPAGDLLVVGSTLPLDATSKSLIGLVTSAGGGNFTWLRSYLEPLTTKNTFTRIVKNPVPQNAAFPYYILGTQSEPGLGSDDVVMLNINANGTFNWKKKFDSALDNDFARDLELFAGGQMILAGNNRNAGNIGSSVIYIVDNNGTMLTGVQSISSPGTFTDVATTDDGEIYATLTTLSNKAHLTKFASDLALVWAGEFPQLTAANQVWEGSPGILYITGRGTFAGSARDAIVKLEDAGTVLDWLKYPHAGTSFSQGSSWLMPSGQIAYTDARTISGSFGQNDAFISISDAELNTCNVSENVVSLQFFTPLPDGPILPLTFSQEIPIGTDLTIFQALDWQQAVICSPLPCTVDFTYDVDCGVVTFAGQSSFPNPTSWEWTFAGGSPSTSTSQNPVVSFTECDSYKVCLTVTGGDPSTSCSVCHTITIVDDVPPNASCLGIGVVLDANCQALITPQQVDFGSTDDCLISSMSISPNIITGCGLFPITLTVTDWCGNTGTCTALYQGIEDIAPEVICPQNVTVTATIPTPCSSIVNNIQPIFVSDNCGTPTVTYTITGATVASGITNASGITFQQGVSTVTYTATDDCGNTNSCSFTVEVRCLMPSLIVNKYNDFDCDGVHDIFESGLSGWIFTLVNNSTSQTYTGTTNALGQYIFQNLPSGSYTLTESPRLGWIATSPPSGSMLLTVGSSNVTVEFGNCGVCMPEADPFICGEPLDVLFVLDNSGSMDASEFGIMRNMVVNSIAQIQSAYSNAQFGVIHYSGDCGEKIYREHDFKQVSGAISIIRRFPPEINDDLNAALLNTIKALNHIPNPNLRPTPISYLNQRTGSNLWVIIFTDAFAGTSGACTGSALLPYTASIALKQTKNAKITLVHFAPGLSTNSISAAIASPGGTYTGPVSNNGYDFNVPGPRQYIPSPPGNPNINILTAVSTCDSVPDHCCDSLMVMTTLNSTGDKCCASVDLKNRVGFPVSKFEAEVINSPGWVFNISSLAHASGFIWESPPTGQLIGLNHSSGKIPLGKTTQALSYCLASTNSNPAASQTVVFRWYAVLPGDSIRRVICTDTLTTNCPGNLGENCIALIDSTLLCNPDNPYEYFFNFTIQNLSGTTMSKVVIQSLTAGIGFSDCNVSNAVTSLGLVPAPNPLPNGAVSSNLCVKIISPVPILTPVQLCFRLGLYSDSLDCNSTDSICMILKPCCDPCDMVQATAELINIDKDCCYKMDLQRSCGYELFTRIETEILTPGVVFGAHSLGGPDAGAWFTYPGATSTSVSYGTVSGAIQQDLVDDIIQFCLDSISSGIQIPQKIVVRWYTSTASGDEVLCTDTIELESPVNCKTECTDGIYSDLFFIDNHGTQSQPMTCGNSPVTLSCPQDGESYTLTGRFHHGDPHEDSKDGLRWTLVHTTSGITHTGVATTNPYFGISLLPYYFDEPGLYELTLTFEDVDQTCTCSLQFNVDCPDLCRCTALDIVEFGRRVERGFAQSYPENSCTACFSPIALNDCETVEWYLNSTNDPPIGTSTGRETFCYDFPDAGDYNIIMDVSKKKDDGANCDKQKRTQAVLPCLLWPECSESVFDNPSFREGAIAGGLNSGGHSNNWKASSGNPKLQEQQIGSFDGWTMLLSGNLDTADILSRNEPICLDKTTGRFSTTVKSGKSNSSDRLFPVTLKVFLGRGWSFPPVFSLKECDGINCFELASVVLPALDSGQWLELQIPYDLSKWDVIDSCGGLLVRPFIYVTNPLSNRQGGEETLSFVQLDNFCFGGTIVAVEEPLHKNRLSIFPNPTTGEIILQFKGSKPEAGVIQILDLYGRIVFSEKLVTDKERHSITIESLPPGIYFVKVLDKGISLWHDKIIKQ